MKYPKFSIENLETRKFCWECGVKLSLICSQGGFEDLPGDKFCCESGHDLTKCAETPPIDYDQHQSYTPKFLADKILITRNSIEWERNLVTVVFYDKVNC